MAAQRPAALLLSFCLIGQLTACKRTQPPQQPQPAATEPAKPAIDAAKLTDEQLAAASKEDGLGVGLRIAGNGTFSASKAIPLHVILEDFGARVPIASGLCGGFYLITEDPVSHELSSGQLTLNPRCFDSDPFPDAIPLEKNKPKIVDSNTQIASHIDFIPGKYLFSIEWHAFPAGPGGIGEREAYTTVHSNSIPITITP
jgi:hypothetical protein